MNSSTARARVCCGARRRHDPLQHEGTTEGRAVVGLELGPTQKGKGNGKIDVIRDSALVQGAQSRCVSAQQR